MAAKLILLMALLKFGSFNPAIKVNIQQKVNTGQKPYEENAVCSKCVNGVCTSPNKCTCNSGWKGETCETPKVKCGIENLSSTRIVNGEDVKWARKYSWQVGIKNEDGPFSEYWCGGSIITTYHILTAAHCICGEQANTLYVGIGDQNQDITTDNLLAFVNPIRANRIIVHPGYNCKKDTGDSDIAIIKLSKSIDLMKHADDIHPICLPKDDSKTYAGLEATVTGWGSTVGFNEGQTPIPIYPKILQVAQIPILNNSYCSAQLSSYLGKQIMIYKTEICAATAEGYQNGGKNACFGDSGGPLSIKETGRHVQVGVVSGGWGCASKGSPEIYARVSKFINWIKKKVAPQDIYTL